MDEAVRVQEPWSRSRFKRWLKRRQESARDRSTVAWNSLNRGKFRDALANGAGLRNAKGRRQGGGSRLFAGGRKNRLHRSFQSIPLRGFLGELRPAFAGERIKARFAIVFGYAPFGADHAAVFKPLQGEVERTVIDKEDFVRLPLDGAGDPLAVAGPKEEDAQDEQIQGALQEGNAIVFFLSGRHTT